MSSRPRRLVKRNGWLLQDEGEAVLAAIDAEIAELDELHLQHNSHSLDSNQYKQKAASKRRRPSKDTGAHTSNGAANIDAVTAEEELEDLYNGDEAAAQKDQLPDDADDDDQLRKDR